MPDVARAIGRCYAAGLPFAVALDRSVDVVPEPVAARLRRAAELANAGHLPGDALAAFADVEGGRALIAAVELHAELGGDLSAALRSLAEGLAAEERLAGDARVATAQARFAGRVVPGLPIAALALEGLADRQLLAPLVLTGAGRAIVAASGVLTLVALIAMHRIVHAIR